MIKYKLISKYPGSPKEDTQWFCHSPIANSSEWQGEDFYKKYPNFYKKIESFYKRTLDGDGNVSSIETATNVFNVGDYFTLDKRIAEGEEPLHKIAEIYSDEVMSYGNESIDWYVETTAGRVFDVDLIIKAESEKNEKKFIELSPDITYSFEDLLNYTIELKSLVLEAAELGISIEQIFRIVINGLSHIKSE